MLFVRIDSEINNIRHFIKITLINKGIKFVDLPSIFRDNTVGSTVPSYFEDTEYPVICCKYNKLIRNTILTALPGHVFPCHSTLSFSTYVFDCQIIIIILWWKLFLYKFILYWCPMEKIVKGFASFQIHWVMFLQNKMNNIPSNSHGVTLFAPRIVLQRFLAFLKLTSLLYIRKLSWNLTSELPNYFITFFKD